MVHFFTRTSKKTYNGNHHGNNKYSNYHASFSSSVSTCSRARLCLIYVKSLPKSRKLALLIFLVSLSSFFSVLFVSNNAAHVNYFYNSYDASTSSSIFTAGSTAGSSATSTFHSSLSSSEIHEVAIAKAKEDTKNWIQFANSDEMELDAIIQTFKSEVQKLKKKQQQEKQRLEEAKAKEYNDAKNSDNGEYYLYYQDDDDTSATVIGMPLLNNNYDDYDHNDNHDTNVNTHRQTQILQQLQDDTENAESDVNNTNNSKNNEKRSRSQRGQHPYDNNDPNIYIRRFVTSLRNTGFRGNIIIGLEINYFQEDENSSPLTTSTLTSTSTSTSNNNNNNNNYNYTYPFVSNDLIQFLSSNNVIIKPLIPISCTFEFAKMNQKCYHPYGHIKREWSYFPLARDWLTSCDTCAGSVALTSIKNTIFQRNPFGIGMPFIERLHLFELHPGVIASDTSAGTLIKACDDIDLDKVDGVSLEQKTDVKEKRRYKLLSAGTAIGARDDVVDYLGAVHSVMREWMHRSQCHFEHSTSDDGMAIVNYLRLQRRLPYRTKIVPHRHGIVNNVGYDGKKAFEAHLYLYLFKGLSDEEAVEIPYEGGSSFKSNSNNTSWIDSEYALTDSEGSFIDVWFQKSAIIYEYNAFGPPFTNWYDDKFNLTSTFTEVAIATEAAAAAAAAAVTNNDIGRKDVTPYQPTDGENQMDGPIFDTTAEGDQYDDDVLVQKNSTLSSSSTQTRKVDNKANNTTEVRKGGESEREQPMYYKDTSSDVSDGGEGNDGDDDGDNNGDIAEETNNNTSTVVWVKKKAKLEKPLSRRSGNDKDEKLSQIVPVEETLADVPEVVN